MKSPIRPSPVYFSNSGNAMRIHMLQVSRPENERAKILSETKFLHFGRDAGFSRKYAISTPLKLQNQQIRFADANRPPTQDSRSDS